jgi:hypothetical protein
MPGISHIQRNTGKLLGCEIDFYTAMIHLNCHRKLRYVQVFQNNRIRPVFSAKINSLCQHESHPCQNMYNYRVHSSRNGVSP